MKQGRIIHLLAAGLLSVSLISCKKNATPEPQATPSPNTSTAGSPPPPPPPEPVKVGCFTSLTGPQATFGDDTLKGTQLAVAEINAAGGVLGRPIDLIVEDTQSKAGETSTIVQELINRDGVCALLGEVASGRSLEAAPIAQRSGIPMITPSSTNEKVTEAGNYVFRVCYIDPFQGKVMSKFARSLEVTKAAVLTDESKDYSKGLSDNFKADFQANHGQIVSEQFYQDGDRDFNAQLTAIKAAQPEVIFLPSYYTEAPLIIRQARQLGIDAPFLGTDGWDSPDLIKVGGAAMNNCYFSNHFSHESKDPKVTGFVSGYTAKYGAAPSALAALAYDSVYILADAIKRAGSTDPAKIRDALAATKNFAGVTGLITYDEKRNPSKSAVIIRVDGGQFKYLQTIQP